MVNPEIQKKLDRLKKLDEGNRDRSKRYLDKIKAQGKKQFSAIVSLEAYEELNRIRNESIKPLSYGAVVESLVKLAKSVSVNLPQEIEKEGKENVNIDVKENIKKKIENNGDIDIKKNIKKPLKDDVNIDVTENIIKTDKIPDCHGKELTQDERDAILIQVGELYPGPKNSQTRAGVLNKAGVPVKDKKGGWIRGEWDSKKTSDNIRLAKKRLNDK